MQKFDKLDIDNKIIYLNEAVNRIAPEIKGFENYAKKANIIVYDLDEILDRLSDIADQTVRIDEKLYKEAVGLIDHGNNLLFLLELMAKNIAFDLDEILDRLSDIADSIKRN